MRRLRLVLLLSMLTASLTVAPAPAPASAAAFRAGFAVRSINPDPSIYAQVWHTSRRRPTGVLPGDGLWARASYIQSSDAELVIVGSMTRSAGGSKASLHMMLQRGRG